MRTPPHLPARSRHDRTERARRHPYGLDMPAQTAPHGTIDFPADFPADYPSGRFSTPFDAPPPPEADEFVEQRLLGIREMSNQAIGSIDDLLQHTV
ncbi:hypothetical protein AB0K12_38450 [Nonomuraea sp. NPDC049419]|uniref:hypothetical protein n=1 Tax=Nonomuraea sp. NPDC049419 TaxID=3155772 RepID=UPI003437C5B8